MKKTLRLTFPQWQGGTGPDYSLGSRILAFLAPQDRDAVSREVPTDALGSYELKLEDGMYARTALLRQLQAASEIIEAEQPSHIITFGGDCLVDQAPISYLHEKYGDSYRVMWVDAHPDISSTSIFPNGNSMVVGNLMGRGDREFASKVKKKLSKEQFIYCGVLKSTNDEEQVLVENSGIRVVPPAELAQSSDGVIDWIKTNHFKHISVHLDVDVIKPELFHSNVFEKQEPISTDCSHGEMSFPQLAKLFSDVSQYAEIVGLTVTELFPWDMMDLRDFLHSFPMFR